MNPKPTWFQKARLRLALWIAKKHICRFEWVVCPYCCGSGRNEYGGRCIGPYAFIGCDGTGKKSKCAQCEYVSRLISLLYLK